jgi:hypothetical protein
MMTTHTLDELKDKSLEEILRQVVNERTPLTIRLSDYEEVIIEPKIKSEQKYWQQLIELGLITTVQTPSQNERAFTPIVISDPPISETILKERR